MKSEVLEKLGIKVKNPDNVIKFLPILSIVDNSSLENKIKILKFHKIPIVKLSQIKIFALESSELERRITISKSNNFFTEVILNPLTLLDFKKYTLKKVKSAPIKKTIDVPVVKEPSVEFIDTLDLDSEFDSLLDDCIADLNRDEVEYLGDFLGNTKVIFTNPINSLVSEEEYERYETLSSLVNNVLQAVDFNLVSRIGSIDDNIMKLILDGHYSNFDILFKSLSYNSDLSRLEQVKLTEVIKIFLTENVNEMARAV